MIAFLTAQFWCKGLGGVVGWLAVSQTNPQCNPTLSPRRVSLLTVLRTHTHTHTHGHLPIVSHLSPLLLPSGPHVLRATCLREVPGIPFILRVCLRPPPALDPFFPRSFLGLLYFLGLLPCLPGSKVKFTPCLPGAHPPAPS